MSTGVNATLLAINAPGAVNAYGDPGVGATAWSGRAPAHLRRGRRRTVVNGAVVMAEIDELFLLRSAGAPVLEVAGALPAASTVLVDDQRTGTTVQTRYQVVGVANRAGGSVTDSLRLQLRDLVES